MDSPWKAIEDARIARYETRAALLNLELWQALMDAIVLATDAVLELPDIEALEEPELLFEAIESIREQNRSLVLVVPENRFALFSDEEWPLVPTFGEALDYIEMERIQRELGF